MKPRPAMTAREAAATIRSIVAWRRLPYVVGLFITLLFLKGEQRYALIGVAVGGILAALPLMIVVFGRLKTKCPKPAFVDDLSLKNIVTITPVLGASFATMVVLGMAFDTLPAGIVHEAGVGFGIAYGLGAPIAAYYAWRNYRHVKVIVPRRF